MREAINDDNRGILAYSVTSDRKGAQISASLNDVMVYALAEKYDIQPLKELARCKFGIGSFQLWQDDDIVRVLQEVYSPTPATDRGLQDVVAEVCFLRINSVMTHKRFRQTLEADAALGLEVLD